MSYGMLANTSNHNFQVSSRSYFSLILVSYCPCNKLSRTQWLKQQTFISYSSDGHKSEMGLIRLYVISVSSGLYFFLEGQRENLFSIPASKGCLHSLALHPLPSSKPAMADRVFFVSYHPDSLLLLFHTLKDTGITLGPLGYNPGKSPYFQVS